MPASYEIDKQRKLVLITAWDVCTAADVRQFRKQVLRDSNFDPSFSQLADFTRVTKIDIAPDEVQMLAATSPFSTNSRRAFVAEDQAIFGISKTFGILRSLQGDRLLRVFRSRADAMEWLMEKKDAKDQAA